jgi:hypothetical protein
VSLIPPQPTGSVPGSGYWNDWIEKLRTLINDLSSGGLSHLLLGGVQGGNATEQYHLTAAEETALTAGFTGTGNIVRDNTPTLITPAIGAATGTSLVLTGNITTGTGTLHKTSAALTDGAAAAAGTLLNAPAAGNPTKWVPIDDNGTIRYIPTW